MANVRSSASHTFISVLNTVNASAQSISKTIDAASDSVDMLTAYITKAKTEQSIAHKIAAKDYLDNIINESALEKSKREAALMKEIGNDQKLQQLFTTNVAEYRALFQTETQP